MPTVREEMRQALSRAPAVLGASRDHVVAYLRSQANPDGGFCGRTPASDLYYTVFALQALLALGAEVPRNAIERYLASFGRGEELDFVHLACLARCWADLGGQSPAPGFRDAVLRRIETFRTPDGGYNPVPAAESGTVYGCFLALGARQDLQAEIPDPGGVLRCLGALRVPEGGYANDHLLASGTTPATAAAATLVRHLGQPVEPELSAWLLARVDRRGGFLATPNAPLPDLLSTAVALHALAGLGASLDPLREPCLDFVDTLWSTHGAFYGTWLDETADCEYTYYGLLALGHLST